jgi:hypothetical protein
MADRYLEERFGRSLVQYCFFSTASSVTAQAGSARMTILLKR